MAARTKGAKRRQRAKRGGGTIRYVKERGCFVGRLNIVRNGKRERPCATGRTQAEVQTRLRQIQAAMDDGALPSRDKETVGIFLTKWVESARLARSTVARYRSLVAKQILAGAPEFAKFKLHEIDGNGQALLDLYALLERQGASASTVRKVHVVLHSAFEDARHLGRLRRNPCDLPKKQKPVYTPPDVRPFSREHEAAFLQAVEKDPFEGLYRLALDSGMRQGELFALAWADVNVATCRIVVRRSLKDDNGRLTVGETKTKSTRSLIVSRLTIEAMLRNSPDQSADALVFPDRDGGYIRRQNFACSRRVVRRRAKGRDGPWKRALRKAAADSGLSFEGFTFHDERKLIDVAAPDFADV
jgi:integrase